MGISPIVGKEELLAILRVNRGKHHEVYEAALEGWQAEAVRQLEAAIIRVRSGEQKRDLMVSVQKPSDHTSQYDRAIRSVEMHTEPKIRLSEEDFAHYVLDDWHWKRQWARLSSSYAPASFSANYSAADVEEDDGF